MKRFIMVPLSLISPLFATAAVTQTAPISTTGTSPTQTANPGFDRSRATAQRPCLSPEQARGLATFVLPALIEGLADRCRGSLGRDAFLRQPATDLLSQRLRADAVPSWPIAKSAIETLNGSRLPGILGDRFIRTVAEGTAADLVLKDFDRTDCGAIDGLVSGLAPLPSVNFSSVITALIALGGDQADGDAPLRICPAAPLVR